MANLFQLQLVEEEQGQLTLETVKHCKWETNIFFSVHLIQSVRKYQNYSQTEMNLPPFR